MGTPIIATSEGSQLVSVTSQWVQTKNASKQQKFKRVFVMTGLGIGISEVPIGNQLIEEVVSDREIRARHQRVSSKSQRICGEWLWNTGKT